MKHSIYALLALSLICAGCKREQDGVRDDSKPDKMGAQAAKKGVFPSGPIDPGTIAAYRKLGAAHGGCLGRVFPNEWTFHANNDAGVQFMPGFHFQQLPTGNLPEVGVPFGLSFGPGAFSDTQLQELMGLKNLTTLCLQNEQVTDTVLRVLADEGLLHILGRLFGDDPSPGRPKSADEVTSLALDNCPVGDAGLKELTLLVNLRVVFLNNTKITGGGMKHLAGFTRMTRLHLIKTNVDDAGLKDLAPLQNLETLNLYGTKITDGGMKDLAVLKRLKSVQVSGTKVTAAGVAELRLALPECAVSR